MNVVGKVGSLITQGVYSVATPFHPFGGAVDIIVVEQEDGTYRSTPWYVRFGKFQGVIKGAEKMVSIAVNGVEANFNMYLDHSGQAYFMREVESGSNEVVSGPPELNRNESSVSNVEDHESLFDEVRDEKYEHAHSYGYGNLEEVEDLVQSSSEPSSEMVLISVDGHVLTAPISSDDEVKTDDMQLSNPQFHLGPGKSASEDFSGLFDDLDAPGFRDVGASGNLLEGSCKDERGEEGCNVGHVDQGSCSEGFHLDRTNEDLFKSCLDLTSHVEDVDLQETSLPATELASDDYPKSSLTVSSCSGEVVVGETATGADLKCETGALQHVRVRLEDPENNVCDDFKEEVAQVNSDGTLSNSDQQCSERPSPVNSATDSSKKVSAIENMTIEASVDLASNDVEQMVSISGRSATEGECSQTEDPVSHGTSTGLGFDISLCGNLLRPGMGRSSAEEAFEAHRISEEEFKASGPSIIKKRNLIVRYKEKYLPWEKAAYLVLGKAAFGSEFCWEPKDSIPVDHEEASKANEDTFGASPSSSRRWRLWPIPFRRASSLQHSNSNSSSEDFFVDSESGLQSPSQSPNVELSPNVNSKLSPRKQLLRTYIPTTEQIASLNLKDGQNIIAFSFSTRVLGRQEVDAHIYLWKWNARIVISDVDGTITKSDVLGQVMPLVGKDWTQSGVAGLFCAIKENGYQLLFLSARAIVQAYLTRSFLLNLKQDGKTLPNGPVVISPDGLFPSLYREVIRRAPHEFKIACLEDIRALFPSDYNPFYAGFGNRDTDELSYRKIGIPKGKIFIINPKGEVAINHCIDVKSYTSLHTLVNDMFPPTSLLEQEDFNSWNYWRMPLPNVD